jgi:hypothetical protein
LKYEAYAINLKEDQSYKKNSQVYVTIPQGNYENRKLIVGSRTDDSDTINSMANLYKKPFN